MLNKVQLIGNVGADPEVRTLQDGAVVATINVATTERYKDRSGAAQTKTEWHRVLLWRNLAEIADKYVRKGAQVFVEGKITTREWTTDSGEKRHATDIVARELKLLGRKSQEPSEGQYADTPGTSSQPAMRIQPVAGLDTPDDLPF